jgi:phosphopantothenoylcysteine decarboxylase
MARILLGVTGSVAAVRTAALCDALARGGHEVRVVATRAATYFFDPQSIGGAVYRDEDEWPGRAEGRRWERTDAVLHIELRRWAELLLVAPLDANTLAKLACGLSDNCLTCVARAWDPARPVVLAPAMNTLMWEHPLTVRHLRQLAADAGAAPPAGVALAELPAWVNAHCPLLRVAAPESRQLACGDVGVGAMMAVEGIVAVVGRCLAGLP